MYFIGFTNTSSQVVLTGGEVDIGNFYHRNCKPTSKGVPLFTFTDNSVTLNGEGIYHITATFVLNGTATGNATIQTNVNGEELPLAYSTETIGVATTEFHTLVIDFFTLVDNGCVLGCVSTRPKTITFENIGVGVTITNVVVNVEKVV